MKKVILLILAVLCISFLSGLISCSTDVSSPETAETAETGNPGTPPATPADAPKTPEIPPYEPYVPDITIISFTIPKFSTKYFENKAYEGCVCVKGSIFTAEKEYYSMLERYVSVSCESNPSLIDRFNIMYNATNTTVHSILFYIPSNTDAGNYDITINYIDKSITATLSIQDYSAADYLKKGDVLLNDGTVIPYEYKDGHIEYSDDVKENAIAVWMGEDEYQVPIGWLGIHPSKTKYEWKTPEEKIDFSDIVYNRIYLGSYWNYVNSYEPRYYEYGDIDGSDNWDYICSVDPVGSADAATNYPAFDYANNYGPIHGLTGAFATGWYIPSCSEVRNIFNGMNLSALDIETFTTYVNISQSTGERILIREPLPLMSSSVTSSFDKVWCVSENYNGVYEGNTGVIFVMRPFNETEINTSQEKHARKVALNKTSLSLTSGNSYQLTASIMPDDAIENTITWESSDPSIAIVSDGMVTAVSKGSAVITAKSGEKSATCTVTVYPKTYRVSVTNGTATPEYAEEGETVTVKADNPIGDTVFDQWTTSDSIILSSSTARTATFTMPAHPVSVYTVTYTDGKKTIVDRYKYKTGDIVRVCCSSFPEKYKSGHSFGWIDDNSNSYKNIGNETFIMGSQNVTLTAKWTRILAEGQIGMYAAPYNVGDIVFNDGSATPISAYETNNLPKEQKDAAIAIIFYSGTENDPLGEKILGVGLHNTQGESRKDYCWAAYNTDGLLTRIKTILCSSSLSGEGAAAIATFTGDTDGKDNWNELCKAVRDEYEDGYYPAWDWANNYYINSKSKVYGTRFSSSWYMPTIAELSMLYRNKNTVNWAITCVGGTCLENDVAYWSSSQNDHPVYDSVACALRFDDDGGFIIPHRKSEDASVCVIRAF